MTRLAAPFVISVLITLAGFGLADAGGSDGSERWSEATPIALGTHSGQLGPGDEADWFIVPHAVNHGIRASLRTDAGERLRLEFIAGPGGYLGHSYTSASAEDGTVHEATLADGGRDGMRIGIALTAPATASRAYTLTLEELPMADFILTGLDVRPRSLTPEGAPATVARERDITVTLENRGILPGSAMVRIEYTSTVDLASRDIAKIPVSLAPGESTTVSAVWDSTHVVGDSRVEVYLDAEQPDADPYGHVRTAPQRTLSARSIPGVSLGTEQIPGYCQIVTFPGVTLVCVDASADREEASARIRVEREDHDAGVEARSTLTAPPQATVCVTAPGPLGDACAPARDA